jgi:hypothetical protein
MEHAILVGGAMLTCSRPHDHRTKVQERPRRCVRRAYVPSMQITAHITVQGAERAATFYADAFGARS